MPDAPSPPRSQAERVRITRGKLIHATIVTLDERGFAATSISAVQARAGVSRGALMHHFATRNALMAGTAEHLLQAALRPTQSRQPRRGRAEPDIAALVSFYWARVVDTAEGRAFIEILLACRTDPDLHAALTDLFTKWDAQIARAASTNFTAASGDPEDAALLWSISRAFLRGMIVHAQFIDDADHINRMITRFGAMLAAQMTMRPPQPIGETHAVDA